MQAFILPLMEAFEQNANPAYAERMSRYMKSKFKFYGINSPLRKDLVRAHIKMFGYPHPNKLHDIISDCWHLPFREFQYTAIELWIKYSKEFLPQDAKLMEWCIINKSWWDTVDTLATNIAGSFFKHYPNLIIPVSGNWIHSENIWLRRTALLFQMKYKMQTDEELLYKYIRMQSHEKAFFIKKAIGWALREYSKTNQESVERFISENTLQPLSKKESLKWIMRLKY